MRAVKNLTNTLAALLIASVAHAGHPDKADLNSTLAGREGNRWVVTLNASEPTRIPRVCASLRASYFEGHPDLSVVVHPEIEYWQIRFKGTPASPRVVLEFDSYPATPEESKPTAQAGDGTLTLRCGNGRTHGEKLRFEPQPHKNTIGYWAAASDSVSWDVVIDQPGAFNVGALQGAGNRGGGVARVSLVQDNKVVDFFEFDVQKTGHFQNFVWRNVGILTAHDSGRYEVRIEAAKIDDVALMDVRQVHLSPKR